MKRTFQFAAILILMLVLPLLALRASQENNNPIQVRIANHRDMVGVGPESDRSQLFVVITNVSSNPVRIWDQWNSWGYSNLTFTVQSDELKFKKELGRFGGGSWWQNGPFTVELAPGEQYVFAVFLKPEDQKLFSNSWGPIKVRNGSYPDVTIQAHYTIKEDDASRRKNVWTGTVSSIPVTFRLADETGTRGEKDDPLSGSATIGDHLFVAN